MNLPAIDDQRKRQADVLLGCVFNRTGEDLPIGEIICPIAVDPDAVSHRQTEISVRSLEADLSFADEPIDQPLLHCSLSAPGGRGIVRRELASIEDERGELG